MMSEESTFYCYRISATDSPKYYIGVSHVVKENALAEDCISHHYWGSGGRKFRLWRDKHEKFLEKEILHITPSREEAYLFEKAAVAYLYKDDQNCLNSTAGGGQINFDVKGYFYLKVCATHRESLHIGETCLRCRTEETFKEKMCDDHGLTIHQGDFCRKCVTEKIYSVKHCEEHGDVKFRKNECTHCSNKKSIVEGYCDRHGNTPFQNTGVCRKCFSENLISIKNCVKHGETKFQAEKCAKCESESRVSVKICDKKHGATKHLGNACCKCTNERVNSLHLENCGTHGLSNHTKHGKCIRCRSKRKAES